MLRLLTATALTLSACVTASAGTTAEAAPGSPALAPPLGWNSLWTTQADGSIRNLNAGLCLDAERAGTANGTPLVLWTCNGQNNQKWTTLP